MNTRLPRFTKLGGALLILSVALVTAATLSSSVLAESATKFQEKARLSRNCASIIIPEGDTHTLFNPATGVVDVSWSVGEQENHVDLPFAATAGCNSKNIALLKKVRQDYTDQVRDTCTEFRGMVTGTIPIPEKNGQQGNIAAAREYVKTHCQ